MKRRLLLFSILGTLIVFGSISKANAGPGLPFPKLGPPCPYGCVCAGQGVNYCPKPPSTATIIQMILRSIVVH